MTTRTLFIGMDGATFTVLDELTRELPDVGVVMPFLAQFLRNGVRAKLRSTPNPLTPPAWVSLMTGRTPGHHGVFDFIRAEEKGGDVYFTLYDARDIRTETVWSIASRQGKTIAALNFPFTAPPPRDVHGFVVPGFIPWKHLRRNTHPTDLYDLIKKEVTDFDPKELAWDFDREAQSLEELSDQDRENWVRYHLPREMQWFRIARYLLESKQPDLMAVMFDGVDKLQHQAWRFLDPALVKQDPAPYERRMRDLCLDYFRRLDGYIADLVTLVGPDAQVFMASDHGFTATTEVVRINNFLKQKGYLEWRTVGESDADRRRDATMFANLDWEKTLAYCRTPSSNGITIRVARTPGETGIAPEEYEGFRDRLITDLETLIDPVSGARIITEIHKREDVFPGSAMSDAPDLLMVLRDRGFVSIKNLDPVVEPRGEPAGTHHPDGIFLAGGQGIAQGREILPRNIVDVGATLLYSLGLPIPRDLEGQVPEAAFNDTWLADHPVRSGPPTESVGRTKGSTEDMSEEEKEKLMEQLQMLGYLE
jgi:predicted AlkP superfamily phosphohydrolase/phosphomutase